MWPKLVLPRAMKAVSAAIHLTRRFVRVGERVLHSRPYQPTNQNQKFAPAFSWAPLVTSMSGVGSLSTEAANSAARPLPLRPVCGRLRVGKDFLHKCSIGRCGHVFGLRMRFT